MLPKKSLAATFPICRYVCCSKNTLSDRIFWKKEIDHQYQFYLATLRAERDAKYILKEHSNLLLRIERAEAENVELRKQIRLLETELYVMYQRNAHDSAVIDGLHEADYVAGETKHLQSWMRHKVDIAAAEGDQEETLSKMLKEQIDLLRRKDVEDAELIVSLKPLEDQLEGKLEEERLKNHQQAAKFKRDLDEVTMEFRNRNRELESIVAEKSSAVMWSDELFRSTYGLNEQASQQNIPEEDTSSLESSQGTDQFVVSAQEEMSSVDDLCEGFQEMKEEYGEFVARKELLDIKNGVNINVIHDCLQQFAEGVQILASEYLSVFEISAKVDFIKEYLERLDAMRKKQEVVNNECYDVQTVQRIDQLNAIYNTLLCEKTILDNSLHYFASTLKDDFESHCVILLKSEELFVKTSAVADSE